MTTRGEFIVGGNQVVGGEEGVLRRADRVPGEIGGGIAAGGVKGSPNLRCGIRRIGPRLDRQAGWVKLYRGMRCES